MEELTAEICGKPLHTAPLPVPAGHVPLPIAVHTADSSTNLPQVAGGVSIAKAKARERKHLGNSCSWTGTRTLTCHFRQLLFII